MEAVLKPLVNLDYLPLALQDPKPAPQAVIKKKKKFRQEKAVDEELEGFVNWTNPVVSQLVKEREAEMSGLVSGFAIRMHKRATNSQEGTTPGLEVPSDKRSMPSRSDEEVQADLVVIVVDSLERILEAPFAVEGCHPGCLSKCLCSAGI